MSPTSNWMPLVATLVVAVYASGLLFRRSGAWYEWAAAAAGVGFAAWFWLFELRRARRRRKGA